LEQEEEVSNRPI